MTELEKQLRKPAVKRAIAEACESVQRTIDHQNAEARRRRAERGIYG